MCVVQIRVLVLQAFIKCLKALLRPEKNQGIFREEANIEPSLKGRLKSDKWT